MGSRGDLGSLSHVSKRVEGTGFCGGSGKVGVHSIIREAFSGGKSLAKRCQEPSESRYSTMSYMAHARIRSPDIAAVCKPEISHSGSFRKRAMPVHLAM